MSFSCGIVGLPNVGKSTLFNALTKSQVPAENYPFCTIEPNKAIVQVPDKRITALATLSKSKKRIHTTIEFVDIAGLVKGASKGEGMGNHFIANIKSVDALIHVIRLFSDDAILRKTPINPIEDLRIIHQELMLYDLEQCLKHISRLEKLISRQRVLHAQTLKACKKAATLLEDETLLSQHKGTLSQDDISELEKFQLVTLKPVIIVGNILEAEVLSPEKNPHYNAFLAYCEENGFKLIELAVELEQEVCDVGESLLDDAISPYLKAVGLTQSGCSRLVKASYEFLSLITFFTTGEEETRAWTVPQNTKAPLAAGRIHSDIQKGFIKADIISSATLIALDSMKVAREQGQIRLEGKDYNIVDGDVCHFKFNL